MSYTITWTKEKQEAAILKLTKYFKEHGDGQSICQNDDAIIAAPDLLASIADDILIYGEGIVYEDRD